MLARTRPWSSTISSARCHGAPRRASRRAVPARARRKSRSPRLTTVRATGSLLHHHGLVLLGDASPPSLRPLCPPTRNPIPATRRRAAGRPSGRAGASVGRPTRARARSISSAGCRSPARRRARPGGHAVVEGLADHARAGAERDRLHHVRAAPDPAVEDDLRAPADRVDDLRQHLDRRGRVVELAATVVRHDDRLDAAFGGLPRDLRGHDPLERDRPRPEGAVPLDVVPADGRAELLAW